MKVVSRIDDLQSEIRSWRQEGFSFGLVPTMGALHDGHLRLVEVARNKCRRVVVTIFVNPTQFAPHEDFDKYPRTFASDREKLERINADILFMPTSDIIYPNGPDSCTKILPPESMSKILCGRSRPHFFEGVAQVCNILFNIIKPDYAFFGEKDRQQLVIIQKMVRDLHLGINVIGVPTVRDENGLALSSRNSYLTEDKRKVASHLFKVMEEVASLIKSGHKDFEEVCNQAKDMLKNLGFTVEYFELRNPDDLSDDLSVNQCIFAAAWLDKTRLIDNMMV